MSKVLIVDDSRVILLTLSRQLQQAGFEVVTQSDALGVLQTVVREKPDLMILDITMDGLQCNTLCRMLRNEKLVGSGLQVVLHSGLSADEMEEKTREWGVHAFMEKSWRVPRKIELVASMLNEKVS